MVACGLCTFSLEPLYQRPPFEQTIVFFRRELLPGIAKAHGLSKKRSLIRRTHKLNDISPSTWVLTNATSRTCSNCTPVPDEISFDGEIKRAKSFLSIGLVIEFVSTCWAFYQSVSSGAFETPSCGELASVSWVNNWLSKFCIEHNEALDDIRSVGNATFSKFSSCGSLDDLPNQPFVVRLLCVGRCTRTPVGILRRL